jgi:hypothetical protein
LIPATVMTDSGVGEEEGSKKMADSGVGDSDR